MAESGERVCATEGCGKPASLACPTCIKLNIPPSYFCAQDCFQRYWGVHKQLHALVKQTRVDPTAMPPEFTGYRFTGDLRPHQRSPRREVPAHIPRPDYAVDGVPRSEIADRRSNTNIRVYTAEEIEGIRAACRIGREVLEEAGSAVRVGITCDELDRIVHEATVARGAYPSPLNYNEFPKSVCTSVNEVICHGIPDMYELKDGDIVNLDISVYYNGYHADLNETFMVGNVDDDSKRLLQTAYESLAAAVAIVRPGTLYRELGQAISRVAHANGCSVVRTYCGHGIGELFHTAPNIPHYAKNKAKGVMKPGHVFTIEPMINLGVWQDVHWPDGWTAVTADGRRSAQFEHTMLVTEEGVELLTGRPGETTMQWDPERFSR